MTLAVWAQTIVLIITAYLIWRYTNATEQSTRETAALRQQTVRQNKISLRPIILPEFPIDAAHNKLFQLRNCGVGCALNVTVDSVRTRRFQGGEMNMGETESRFDPIEYLRSGGKAEVVFSTWADGQRLTGTPFRDWFHPHSVGEETLLVINFGDVENQRYRIRVTIAAEENSANLPRTVKIEQIEELQPHATKDSSEQTARREHPAKGVVLPLFLTLVLVATIMARGDLSDRQKRRPLVYLLPVADLEESGARPNPEGPVEQMFTEELIGAMQEAPECSSVRLITDVSRGERYKADFRLDASHNPRTGWIWALTRGLRTYGSGKGDLAERIAADLFKTINSNPLKRPGASID